MSPRRALRGTMLQKSDPGVPMTNTRLVHLFDQFVPDHGPSIRPISTTPHASSRRRGRSRQESVRGIVKSIRPPNQTELPSEGPCVEHGCRDLIAASIYENYSIGPSIRPICTRCCPTVTNEIQVCSSFQWAPAHLLGGAVGRAGNLNHHNFTRTSVHEKSSGLTEITTYLDYTSHCKVSPGKNWSNRWTNRVFIMNTARSVAPGV
jgi:hypothetical protein